ncbi:MAG: Na+/H+ antiporter NhaC family protein [Kocuria sp.]|nr:Na+/H+ antiporter NhaC family protein [Kocuria sp.]
MEALTNPVLLSVLALCVLSLLNVNVLLALLVAALLAGLLAGQSVVETTEVMISGLGGQGQTALAYILLGVLAVMVGRSGLPEKLVSLALPLITGRRGVAVFFIAGVACLSQNIVPVHIAFIPILIPPLLSAFNSARLDRRAVACALTFGLKAPYLLVPLGFGLIFQGIVVDEMTTHGMDFSVGQMPLAMAIPVAGMVVGLVVAVLISYRRDRTYQSVTTAFDGSVGVTPSDSELTEGPLDRLAAKDIPFTWRQGVVIGALVFSLVVQILTESLVIAALGGVLIMFLFNVERWRDGETIIIPQGVAMMGTIAFIMLVASGYATVLTETGSVESLVESMSSWIGDSHLIAALVMMFVGLLVTMGIGTSFGTIPVVAAIFVPLAATLGFSPLATASLIGTAAALGDAGSPASDSTLGPTSGLNADGQHHHIWDTCVPTFLHYNIPLFIGGVVAALVL